MPQAAGRVFFGVGAFIFASQLGEVGDEIGQLFHSILA